MKGLILFAAALGLSANAQTITPYEGYAFSKNSPDGKWLIEETNGLLTVYETATGTAYAYGDDFDSYIAGLGNCVNNAGTLVGCMPSMKPGYWNAGTKEWKELPTSEQDILFGSLANSITPDGKYICGSIATGNYLANEESLNLTPAVWTLQENGEYGMYEFLPCPQKDFLGKTPQYATAIDISDDGRTVIGQLVDNSGFYTMTLLYRKGDDGKWTYSIPHPELIYDAEAIATLPEPPGDTPRYPDATSYMDDEGREAYNAAVEAYNKAIDDYYAGITDEFPQSYPNQTDYLSEEAAAAYQEALNQYYTDSDAYWERYAEYQKKLSEAVTGRTYNWNSVALSGNGKYAATELTERPLTGYGIGTVLPVRMEISDDDVNIVNLKGEDMLTTSVTNDGMVVAASPATEYTRTSFVFENAEAEPKNLVDFVSRFNDELADWMNENLRFTVIEYDYDPETYEETSTIVEDSLVTGTAHMNTEGSLFSSFLYDVWSGSYMPLSYVVDLHDIAGIRNLAVLPKRPVITVKDGRMHIDGDFKSVSLYNAEGRLVSSTSSAAALPGCYVVRMEDHEGNVWTERIIVK